MVDTQKLTDLLADYFGVGDSYNYTLNRTKEAFGTGTMTFDDFEEFNEEDIEELVEFLGDSGEVVHHGRWAWGDEMPNYPRVNYKNFNHYCSVCRAVAHRFGYSREEFLPDYCPDCGAKMDLEG